MNLTIKLFHQTRAVIPVVVVFLVGLFVINAHGQTPSPAASRPVPPSPGATSGAGAKTAAPDFSQAQLDAMKILKTFYKNMHQDTPGSPGTNLSETIDTWMQPRTIKVNVKVGEKLVEYERGWKKVPIMEVQDRIAPPRIRFADFPDTEDYKGTNAEYNSETESLQIRLGITDALNDSVHLPVRGESAVDRVTLGLEYAQTIVHEFLHATQGDSPGSPVNEALAYRGALDASHRWLETFEQTYAASRTKENARQLWAATKVWQEYKATIEGKIKDGDVDAAALHDRAAIEAEASRLKVLQERVANEHRTMESLEGLSGTSAVPGLQPTLDELLTSIKARTPADLEAKLLDAARKNVDRGAGEIRGNPNFISPETRENAAQKLVKASLPLVRTAWEGRLAKAAAAARRLQSFNLEIAMPSLQVEMDLSRGAAEVALKIANDPEFAAILTELGRALQAATGDPSALSVTERWRATDVEQAPRVWRMGVGTTFELKESKVYEIHYVRFVRTRLSLPNLGILPTIELKSSELLEVVPPDYPAHQLLAGNWNGSLTITELPFLDLVAATPSDSSTSPDDVCQLPLGQIGPALSRLKGQAMHLALKLRPTTEDSGMAELLVTPPSGFETAASAPQRYSYTYQEGRLSIDVTAHKDTQLKMTATVVSNGTGLSFKGAWEVFGTMNGRSVLAMKGTWFGTKRLP